VGYGENGTESWVGYRCTFTHHKGVIECSLAGGPLKEYENREDEVEDTGSAQWWLDMLIAAILVCTAGMMSGLTIGLFGLDITTLDILSRSGNPSQRKYAKRILPLLKQHHLLLVTLLLMNALAMEALPVFLERLVSPAMAILISVSLILFFGEIVPQALCTRYGLAIGGNLCYVVWVLIAVCFIIAYPIAKLLDYLLGTDHGTFFKREELKHLIDLHGRKNITKSKKSKSDEERLFPDEIAIIKTAMDFNGKKVSDIMIPLSSTFMLNVEKKMTKRLMNKIIDSGQSRIPVYHHTRENIVGMLLIKNLVLIDPEEEVPIASLELTQLQTVSASVKVYDMINIFQQGSHMAIVVDNIDNISPLGIVRLETIIEELIQKKIITGGNDMVTIPIEESSIDPPENNTTNNENDIPPVRKSIPETIKETISKVLKKDQEITKAPLLSDTPINDDMSNMQISSSLPKSNKKKKKKKNDHIILISDDSDSKE